MSIEKENKEKQKNENKSNSKKKESKKEKDEIALTDLIGSIIEGFNQNKTEENKNNTKRLINKYLIQQANKIDTVEKYNILVLYDPTTMIKQDADNIYNSISKFENNKPLLLIVYSNGGVIGSAYLIGQLCREYSNNNFIITVPRQAKSSATLLCCAADEIHMGSLSELGPIDPQINGLPALGLKNSIKHIAQLVKETPESAEMFAKYLHYSLQPIDLGYYERVAESAIQYAERLLNTHANKLPKKASEIAYELVYTYKDHGFVIDKNEAKRIFGEDVIKINTLNYKIGNQLYKDLNFIENILNYLNYRFYFIGSLDSDPIIKEKN